VVALAPDPVSIPMPTGLRKPALTSSLTRFHGDRWWPSPASKDSSRAVRGVLMFSAASRIFSRADPALISSGAARWLVAGSVRRAGETSAF